MPEFQHEMANTRKMLEAIPEESFDYKSNEKAMSLAQLANHITEIPTWVRHTFLHPELDFSTFTYIPNDFRTIKELLDFFDKTVADAQKFYEVHAARPFYGELVEFMSRGPIVAAILEKDNAIEDFRTLIGATNPADAAEGTIRKKYAKSIGENAVHGSDSDENAAIESAFHFAGREQF